MLPGFWSCSQGFGVNGKIYPTFHEKYFLKAVLQNRKLKKGFATPLLSLLRYLHGVKNRKFQSKYASGDHIFFIQTRGTRTGTHSDAACLPPRRPHIIPPF